MPEQHSPQSLMTQLLLVVASLFCGTGVWLVVQLNERAEMTLDVEAVPSLEVDPRVTVEILRPRVPVRFSYPEAESNKMRADNFVLRVDFPDVLDRFGDDLEVRGDVILSPEMVESRDNAALDMRRLNITPTDVLLRQVGWVARLRTIDATVVPQIEGRPAEGFTYDPNQVVVEEGMEIKLVVTRAKQAQLREQGIDILTIETAPISIEGKAETIRQQVPLLLDDGISLPPSAESDTVSVIVDIVERQDERVIPDVPLVYQFISASDNLIADVDPPRVDVVLKGRVSAINRVRPEMITLNLFGVGERPGESREVAVSPVITDQNLRESIVSIETRPRTVTVTIREKVPPSPTPSPSPTATPKPTASPSPTETPEPTASPSPQPTPIPADATETPEGGSGSWLPGFLFNRNNETKAKESEPTVADDDKPTS